MSPDDPHRRHAATPDELKALNDMRRSGQAFVAWRDDAGALRLLALDPSAPRTTIGRSPASAISLAWDSAVSGLHAEIQRVDEQWLVVDDISTNGTFVAGRRVHGRARVRDEDRIVIGDTVLAFHGTVDAPVGTTHVKRVLARTDLTHNEFRVLKALCRPIVLGGQLAPASNDAIKDEVYLTLDGVKHCLTRLFVAYGIPKHATSKREELAHAAVNSGVIGRHTYV